MRFPVPLLILATPCIAACFSEPVDADLPGATTAEAAPGGDFESRVYERGFVFTTVVGDSAFQVPWLVSARTGPEAVEREARGWLARGGSWDAFYSRRWTTPPTRVPWRILPHEGFRILIGDEDAVEGIVFEEGSRELELELGDVRVEWGGPRGEVFRVVDAALYLLNERIEGVGLDLSRTYAADDPLPGDWSFVVSGDSLQFLLESPEASLPGTTGAYRGWARLGFRDLRWPALTVDWSQVRPYEPARQDVPMRWTVTADDGDLAGALEVRAAQIRAGEGAGPLLPVDALFEVSGSLTIEGAAYPVRGLFRHSRP